MQKQRPIVGVRIIKTCLSVAVIYLISLVTGYPTAPINAYIAGIMSMKDNVENTIDYGIKRTVTTIFGGIAAFGVLQLLTLFEGSTYDVVCALAYPVGVGIILFVSARYGFGEMGALGATIYLIAIIGYSGVDIYIYVFIRTVETIGGIVVAVLINRYFMPKRSMREREQAEQELQGNDNGGTRKE